jgi:hypothetical protein
MVMLLSSCCFFHILDSSSTRENPVLLDNDGHFAVSIAVIASRCNFFHKLTEGKSVNGFFCICCIWERSHFVRNSHFDTGLLFLHHCSPYTNIFIHNSYSPSFQDSLFVIGSIDGDVSTGAPMSQKVLGFSQQRTIPAMTWKNAKKIMVHFDPSY